jgi:hypothetical protein
VSAGLSQREPRTTHPVMRRTHNRSQRFGGHTKHTFCCSCGRQVSGNGGKRHFKLEGHRRIGWEQWRAEFGESR